MAESESTIVAAIRLHLSRGRVRLWRNNTGALFDRTGRLVTFGLCAGSSDLIGYQSVTITPEMVGKRVAVFVALEAKTRRGQVTPAQRRFLALVQQAGGVAGVVRGVADAHRLLAEWNGGEGP